MAQASVNSAAPPQPMTAQAVAAYFDTTLPQQLAEDHIVGATVAVVKDGELLFVTNVYRALGLLPGVV